MQRRQAVTGCQRVPQFGKSCLLAIPGNADRIGQVYTDTVSEFPTPIDPRGPRFNQAVLSVALLVSFVLDVWVVAPVFAVVLGLGAALGPRFGLFLRIYADVVRPRLGPPREMEDPRPPRFAAVVGTVFLAAATLSFLSGSDTVGWGLALVVAALAGLAATTGICVGCEVYLFVAKRRGLRMVA